MYPSSPLRRGALVLAGATALASLTIAAPASAEPVFVGGDTHLVPVGYVYNDGSAACTYAPVPNSAPPVAVVENGAAATATGSSSGTFANTGNAGDNGSWHASTTATAKITSAGGNPKTFDFTAHGSFALANQLGTSACQRGGTARVDFDYSFDVAQAGFLDVSMKGAGSSRAYSEVYVYQAGPDTERPYYDNYGWGLKFSSSAKVLLPPGHYYGYFESESYVDQLASISGTNNTAVHAQFTVAGAQTRAVAGAGRAFVTLPSARSCAAHDLATRITASKKRAHQIKTVAYFVNGHAVRRVRAPHRNRVVTLPIADDATADVLAVVKLVPARAGAPGRVVRTSASYEACS